MRVTADRKALLAALSLAGTVAPARHVKTIIQGVKIEACPEHGTTVMATDLEVGIRRTVLGVDVREAGAAILPTQRLLKILSTSTDTTLDIEVDKTGLEIRGSHAKFTLPSEDPDLFPEVPQFEAAHFHAMAADAFRDAIRRTMFSTDAESTRYALGGVLLELTGDSTTFVGTDGRRLARQISVAEAEGAGADASTPIVVPVKALKLMERAVSDGDPPVHLAVDPGKSVLLRTESAVIYTRLVEGRFPRYQDVFPATAEARIEMGVGELLAAVEQAAILTSDESRGVDFTFGGDHLSLKTNAADVGSASVTLPIVYGRDPVEISFDPRYLTEALRVLDPASRVTAELIDGKSAAVFKTEDGYQYVIMPLTRDR